MRPTSQNTQFFVILHNALISATYTNQRTATAGETEQKEVLFDRICKCFASEKVWPSHKLNVPIRATPHVKSSDLTWGVGELPAASYRHRCSVRQDFPISCQIFSLETILISSSPCGYKRRVSRRFFQPYDHQGHRWHRRFLARKSIGERRCHQHLLPPQ